MIYVPESEICVMREMERNSIDRLLTRSNLAQLLRPYIKTGSIIGLLPFSFDYQNGGKIRWNALRICYCLILHSTIIGIGMYHSVSQ